MMIKKFKIAAAILGLALPLAALAQDVKTGLETTAVTAFGKKPIDDPTVIIGNIIKAALEFVSVIFFALIIYGGFMWMTAGGNEQKIEKAKSLITSAVIGVIIIAAGYAITTTVVNALVGAA